jgi:hypothetical protein
MPQLLMTMRAEFAKQYAKDRSVLDMSALLEGLDNARVIGKAGYSTRIVVEDSDVDALKAKLESSFIIEPDYTMHGFDSRPRQANPAQPGQGN